MDDTYNKVSQLIVTWQVLDKENQMDNPLSWLPDAAWDNITELDKQANFHGLVTSFEQYPRDWNMWYIAAEPESTPLPGTMLSHDINDTQLKSQL